MSPQSGSHPLRRHDDGAGRVRSVPRADNDPIRVDSGSSCGIEGPYTLRIPRIGVDATVVPIQANEERVLDPQVTPASPDGGATALPQANWKERRYWSDTPYATRRGVFDDIGDLTRGDAIKVEGTDATLTYRVRSIDVLSKEEVARRAEEIFSQTGAGRLVVITCEDWDGKAWKSNIVTIAAPV